MNCNIHISRSVDCKALAPLSSCLPSIGALRRSSTREARFRGCCFSAVQGCSARGVLHGAINTSKSTNIVVTCLGKKHTFKFVNVDTYNTIKF
ncbi:unnamed protein product [Ixodes pacificus]